MCGWNSSARSSWRPTSAAVPSVVTGEHPDWDEYRQVMVEDRRLVAVVTFGNTYTGGTHT